jgi:hypothetical protein
MGKLTSHEIRESFSRSELTKNPVLLSLANFSQVKGIYEDEHKLNEEEKDHMLEEYYADLTRDADAYKKLVDDEKPRLKAAKIAGGMSEELAEIEAESEAVSKADKSDTGSRLRKRIRAMQVEEFEMLNNIRPDFLVEPRFVPMVRSGTMETLRSSRVLTNSQRDEMRAAKYAPYDRLKEAMVGIYRGADEAATAAGTPLVLTQLQIDDLNRIETIMQRTVSDRYSPKETASAPGSIRKNAVTWQNLNRGVLNLYRGAQGKDQYEAVDIIKFYKRAVDAGAVTAEMANVLEWMGPTGPKEGKEFYAIASGAGPDAQINFAVAANARVLGAGEFITDLSVLGKDHVLNV